VDLLDWGQEGILHERTVLERHILELKARNPGWNAHFFLMTSTHSTKMESAIRTAGLSMALSRGRDFVDDIEEH
jgi:hypothetical protein